MYYSLTLVVYVRIFGFPERMGFFISNLNIHPFL
jgi:hypothetical protein